jgi:hypothetical protein
VGGYNGWTSSLNRKAKNLVVKASCIHVDIAASWKIEEGEDKIKMDLSEMGCEEERGMVQSQDLVLWLTLILVILNLGVLLP